MSKKDLRQAVVGSAEIASKSDSRVGRLVEQALGGAGDSGTAFRMLPGARLIPLDQVHADPNQPRKTMDQASLKEMAESMKERGVIAPITVIKDKNVGGYMIVTGHRRTAAARLAGLPEIPAIVLPESYEEQSRLQDQLIENIHRESFRPVEEARALQVFMESQQLSQRTVAQKLGKATTYIAELLAILRIDDKILVKAADLPKRALIEIARAETPKEQAQLLHAAMSSKTPWRDVRESRAAKTEASKKPRRVTQRYDVPELHAAVTVSFENRTAGVDTRDIIEALTKVVQRLAAEEIGRLGGGPPDA